MRDFAMYILMVFDHHFLLSENIPTDSTQFYIVRNISTDAGEGKVGEKSEGTIYHLNNLSFILEIKLIQNNSCCSKFLLRQSLLTI